MTTKYYNVEFMTTIPVRVDVPDDISSHDLASVVTKAAWEKVYEIEGADGMGNWIIPSGTFEPMLPDEVSLIFLEDE